MPSGTGDKEARRGRLTTRRQACGPPTSGNRLLLPQGPTSTCTPSPTPWAPSCHHLSLDPTSCVLPMRRFCLSPAAPSYGTCLHAHTPLCTLMHTPGPPHIVVSLRPHSHTLSATQSPSGAAPPSSCARCAVKVTPFKGEARARESGAESRFNYTWQEPKFSDDNYNNYLFSYQWWREVLEGRAGKEGGSGCSDKGRHPLLPTSGADSTMGPATVTWGALGSQTTRTQSPPHHVPAL